MKEKLLVAARAALIAGVIVMAAAVFLETNNVALFSTAKADLEAYKKGLEETYKLDKPAVPVDYSKKLVEPVKPAEDAAAEEKSLYDSRLKEYGELKAQEEAAYAQAKKDFDKANAEYLYQKGKMDLRQAKEEESVKKQTEQYEKRIADLQVTINAISLSVLLRFLGVILLLLGGFGVLALGENMERVGVLVMLGFAFKTIIGL